MKKNKILNCCILVVWLFIIFLFSNEPHSGEETRSFIHNVLTEVLNLDISNKLILNINYIMRKCAHISEFLILSLILNFTLGSFIKSKKKVLALSVGLAFIFACIDELHQYYVPGRSALFTDVLIDMIGVIIASVIVVIIWKLKKGSLVCD